jgi:HSP20 family molecular chaperone IbpA
MNTTQELQHSQPQTDAAPMAAWRIRPRVDLVESESGFVMTVEMPGVDHEHVDVSLERNVLSISGQAVFAVPDGYQPVAGEAGSRIYERSFQLSDDIDRDNIDAEVKNGVLTLKFSKAQRARKTSVAVKGA